MILLQSITSSLQFRMGIFELMERSSCILKAALKGFVLLLEFMKIVIVDGLSLSLIVLG